MVKTKYIALGLHLLCCMFLIIQMALGAVYYSYLDRRIGKTRPFNWETVQTRVLTREKYPEFIDSRDTLYCIVVLMLVMSVGCGVSVLSRKEWLQRVLVLTQQCLLVVYIVGGTVLLLNAQSTHSQQLVVQHFYSTNKYIVTGEEYMYLAYFYHFYVLTLVGLAVLPALTFSAALFQFKLIAPHHLLQQQLDQEI